MLMFLSVNTWTVVELAEVLDVDMKDGLIGQKAVAQLWLKLCKAKQSQAEPHFSGSPIGSWARLKLSLAPWLSRAELSAGNTTTHSPS